ncbi:helix-turn-helix domain-containing protein [Brevibacillus reuszeri]|uniref:helix-turn-helix domain-containing protein n=1 Tax=Brevibacillus reuszeri TaxID=54915 RepID=UPI003D1EDF80
MAGQKTGRWIDDEELGSFGMLAIQERLRWIREELNKLYPGDYTVKSVSNDCGMISHQGLYNLEKGMANPRQSTLAALVDFYNISLETLLEASPSPFFLGKRDKKLSTEDLRGTQYSVEVVIRLHKRDNSLQEEQELIAALEVRHMDYMELCERIRMEAALIEHRLEKQKRLDEAIHLLSRKKDANE